MDTKCVFAEWGYQVMVSSCGCKGISHSAVMGMFYILYLDSGDGYMNLCMCYAELNTHIHTNEYK